MRLNKHLLKKILSVASQTAMRGLLYRKSLLAGLLLDIGVSIASEVIDVLTERPERREDEEWLNGGYYE